MQEIQNIDNIILLFIKNNMHSYLMDKIMIAFTDLGNVGMLWIAILLFLISIKKYRKISIMLLFSLLLSTILGEGILKHIIQRQRPCFSVPAVQLLIPKPLTYSFPSGHTASAFAAAGVLAKYFRKYIVSIYIVAILISFSRLYLYVHYPSDVLAGIILGLLCSKIAINIFDSNKYRKGWSLHDK
jgi:Membrane-associated phospholipid phosphatase